LSADVTSRPLDGFFDDMLERPLSRRRLLRWGRDLGLAGAASALLSACGSAAATGRTLMPTADMLPNPPNRLVMLIIDAGRPDYLGYTELPHIRALKNRGTFYDRAWCGQMEATTPASHASLGTGCFPCSDGGILGFWWEDPVTGTTYNSVPLDGTDPDSLSVLIGDSGAPSMAEYLKRSDARAKVYTASGQKFYAADAIGGPHADYISYYSKNGAGDWAPTCIEGHGLPASLLEKRALAPSADSLKLGHQDALVGELALDVIRKERPRIVALNLPEMDWPVAHLEGGPLAPTSVKTVMRNADRVLGKIINEYKRLGMFDETVFMLLGDHGVTPYERFVDGHQIKAAIESVAVPISFDSNTACYAWLETPGAASVAASAIENAGVTNLGGVYYLVESNGRRSYLAAPATAAHLHPTLDAAHRYLLQTMAGSNAPHVVCMYPERTGTLGAGGKWKWLGDHGGVSWGSQGIPLIIAGPGVKQNHVSHFPARLVDIAPTAMRLLGIPYPQADGVVLADAQTSPNIIDQQRQRYVARYLVPYAASLRRQSAIEVQGLPAMVPRKPRHASGRVIALGPGY